MPSHRCFVVDAFTDRPFSGNPAAVVPLEAFADDASLAAIAAEMNLSETAFFVPEGDDYRLRWFTPKVEVDLCGHATLASAFVLLTKIAPSRERVTFHTRSGPLVVTRASDGALAMDFPSRPPRETAFVEAAARALGARPTTMLRARDLVCVFEREADVRALAPDLGAIAALDDTFAVIATAAGDATDFVSRFFAPAKGVPEDPVTGSAHCTLTPYWAARLGRKRLRAAQVGPRGGTLTCTLHGDRVVLEGRAVLVLEGTLHAT